MCVYFIAGLRGGGEAVWYFILNLFLALVTVESLMMVRGGREGRPGGSRRGW